MNKHMKNLLLAAGLLALGASSVSAATITIGSMTIEGTQTLDTAYISSGALGIDYAFQAQSDISVYNAVGVNGGSNGVNGQHSLGYLLGNNVNNNSLNFGGPSNDGTKTATVTMSLAGKVLTDVNGNDIWVTESGSLSGNSEGFMARVYSGTSWSSWVYKFSSESYIGNGSGTTFTGKDFYTGYDFVSDFGLLTTDQVSQIQIANMLSTYTVSGAGEGIVTFGPGGNTPFYGPISGGATTPMASTAYDADLGYVFYSAAITTVPEPSTYVLLGLGLVLSVYGLKISRRKKQSVIKQ